MNQRHSLQQSKKLNQEYLSAAIEGIAMLLKWQARRANLLIVEKEIYRTSDYRQIK
ncbi:hypothetical protein SynA1562_02650 [Synechococcus sp. A15-62]|nr:hypothetical protein SynA1562_02650 [Synechococcus sp. A15-62]